MDDISDSIIDNTSDPEKTLAFLQSIYRRLMHMAERETDTKERYKLRIQIAKVTTKIAELKKYIKENGNGTN